MRPDHMGPLEHQRDCPHGDDRDHCRLCDLERENARLLSGMKREQARADMAEADKAKVERDAGELACALSDLLGRFGNYEPDPDAMPGELPWNDAMLGTLRRAEAVLLGSVSALARRDQLVTATALRQFADTAKVYPETSAPELLDDLRDEADRIEREADKS